MKPLTDEETKIEETRQLEAYVLHLAKTLSRLKGIDHQMNREYLNKMRELIPSCA